MLCFRPCVLFTFANFPRVYLCFLSRESDLLIGFLPWQSSHLEAHSKTPELFPSPIPCSSLSLLRSISPSAPLLPPSSSSPTTAHLSPTPPPPAGWGTVVIASLDRNIGRHVRKSPHGFAFELSTSRPNPILRSQYLGSFSSNRLENRSSIYCRRTSSYSSGLDIRNSPRRTKTAA